MGLLDLFKRSNTKAMATMVRLMELGAPRWMNRSGRSYAQEGYAQNVIAFRCVEIISKSMGIIPIKIVDQEGGEVSNPALEDLLVQPNVYQGWSAFVQEAVAWRLITGSSYVEASADSRGVPRELINWKPYYMKPAVKRGGDQRCRPILVGWVWEWDTCKAAWDVDPITGKSPILAWHTFNPFDEFCGMSPMAAAAYSIDQHNSSSEWNQSMLQNAAMPSGALATQGTLTDAQFKRAKEQMAQDQQGEQNAKNIMVLEGGLDWKQFSLTPAEMDWLAGRKSAGSDIAGAYGVPTQVIPIPGEQTYANYAEARLALWEDTILPLMDDFLDELNRWLVPMATGQNQRDASIKLVMDENAIPALAGRRRERWEMVNQSDFLTINEKREAVNYDPRPEPEADQIWIGAGQLPLDLDVTLSEEDLAKQLEGTFPQQKARDIARRVASRAR